MVAPIPIVTWLALAAAGSTAVFQKFVKPRLPVYTLQVDRVPRLRWIEDHGVYKTMLPTRVTLMNENYVGLDIHALSFDLFYTAWDGSLQHLGNVQDRHQQQKPNVQTVNNNNKTSTSPVWQIQPRAHFDFQDEMYLAFGSLSSVLSSTWTLAKQFWRNSGRVILPSTGVAHVTSNGISATVSMICDNVVHMLEIQGRECTLRDVQPGWVSLDETSASLRLHVQDNATPSPDTGGLFLQTRTKDGFVNTKPEGNGNNNNNNGGGGGGGDVPTGLQNLVQILKDSQVQAR